VPANFSRRFTQSARQRINSSGEVPVGVAGRSAYLNDQLCEIPVVGVQSDVKRHTAPPGNDVPLNLGGLGQRIEGRVLRRRIVI
jgi:hypothetical protein